MISTYSTDLTQDDNAVCHCKLMCRIISSSGTLQKSFVNFPVYQLLNVDLSLSDQ
jgi:hypothetical protein